MHNCTKLPSSLIMAHILSKHGLATKSPKHTALTSNWHKNYSNISKSYSCEQALLQLNRDRTHTEIESADGEVDDAPGERRPPDERLGYQMRRLFFRGGRCRSVAPASTSYISSPVVWTSLGPLPWWVPGPATRWAPGTI
jgi:hypothetical protein